MGIEFSTILSSVGQVLLAGLLLGAGLPALFALGMRMLSAAEDADGKGRVATAAGWTCFGMCIVAAVFGIVVIVFGHQIFG